MNEKNLNLIYIALLSYFSFLISVFFIFPFSLLSDITSSEFLTGFYTLRGDVEIYLEMASGNFDVIEPYRFRILVPLLTYFFHTLFNIEVVPLFIFINSLFLASTSILLYFYLDSFDFSLNERFLGSILFLLSSSVIRTSSFAVLEPATYFFAILIISSLKIKNYYLFLGSLILGILVKELLIIFIFVFLITYEWKKDFKTILIPVSITIFIVIFFSFERLLLGGDFGELSYGYNILAGQFPAYYQKLFNIGRLINWIFLVFITFNFMWYGLFTVWKDKFLFKSAIVIPIAIIAQLFLASRVERNIFVVFPIIIPTFIILFRALTRNEDILPSTTEKIKFLSYLPSSITTYIEKFFHWVNRNSITIMILLFILTFIPQSFFILRQFYGF
ncbi:MAG: hypothetical protein ACFFAU_16960 [Candidatus Hodarchaeota archaeon]